MPLSTVPYTLPRLGDGSLIEALGERLAIAQRRRTVRQFSTDPVPREAIELAIAVAGTAPSGAHRQPWHFVAIGDPATKAALREAAEAEERVFYERRATPAWLAALEPLGTDAHKAHLTDAPWVIAVFGVTREADGEPNYYVQESVGIAVGMLLGALNDAGLATLTHTPSPMGFIRQLLERPERERPMLLIPVGHPAHDCQVPDMGRKPVSSIASFR